MNFKHVNNHTSDVYYRDDKKSYITRMLFPHALLSEVEKYQMENDIPFKILIIVDYAPEHASFMAIVITTSKWCFSHQTINESRRYHSF